MTNPAALRTAVVSDALDRLGLSHQVLAPGIRPLEPRWTMAGTALPALISTAPVGSERATGYFGLIDSIQQGDVIVLNCDREASRSAVWGELLARSASAAGAAGVVTPALVRDAPQLVALDLPVFARGSYPVSPDGRVDVVTVAQPTTIDGATVTCGDLVVGDGDGVAIVPSDARADVEALAVERESTEREIGSRLDAGVPLREAFESGPASAPGPTTRR